jgi:hypothetical protein
LDQFAFLFAGFAFLSVIPEGNLLFTKRLRQTARLPHPSSDNVAIGIPEGCKDVSPG